MDIDREKELVRERYRGVSSDRIKVIPAKEESDIFEDSGEKRIAVYVRVSTNSVQQTSSFELQQGHYMDVIRQHPGWILHKIYADEGISGTSLKHRDAFLEMIRDCEDGLVDLIVSKSVSRFSRNVYDCVGYVRRLAALKHPVGVYFETEHIYTLKQDSEMGMDFIAVLAQEESRAKSNSMNLSYEMRFRRGIVLTPELLGYDLNEKKELVVNEEEALTVRLIFFLYLYGFTCQKIADTLVSLKRRTKRGSIRWSAGTVLNILQNERHCGDVLARKTWTPNYLDHKARKNVGNRNQYLYADHHEAIIARDDFIAVQRLIANARHRYKGILPSLKVIDHGALRGFVSINPRWAGFKKEDYLCIAATVAEKAPALDQEYEAQKGEFDLRGFEVTRGQFFPSVRDSMVTFSHKGIFFSSSCLGRLEYVTQVELLLDPIRKIFAVRPASKECRNGVVWLSHDGKRHHSKQIAGTAFMDTFFQLLRWEPRCKYRVRGICRKQDKNAVLLFHLDDTEVVLPKETTDGLSPKALCSLPEGERPLSETPQKNTIAYPVGWSDEFGTDYYRYAQIQELCSFAAGADWKLQHPGVSFPDPEGLAPTPPDELDDEIKKMIFTMKERVKDGGAETQ